MAKRLPPVDLRRFGLRSSDLERRAPLEKGDYVGHPFRGNQWTTSEGASRLGPDGAPPADPKKDEEAYNLRQQGMSWEEIAKRLGYANGGSVRRLAMRHEKRLKEKGDTKPEPEVIEPTPPPPPPVPTAGGRIAQARAVLDAAGVTGQKLLDGIEADTVAARAAQSGIGLYSTGETARKAAAAAEQAGQLLAAEVDGRVSAALVAKGYASLEQIQQRTAEHKKVVAAQRAKETAGRELIKGVDGAAQAAVKTAALDPEMQDRAEVEVRRVAQHILANMDSTTSEGSIAIAKEVLRNPKFASALAGDLLDDLAASQPKNTGESQQWTMEYKIGRLATDVLDGAQDAGPAIARPADLATDPVRAAVQTSLYTIVKHQPYVSRPASGQAARAATDDKAAQDWLRFTRSKQADGILGQMATAIAMGSLTEHVMGQLKPNQIRNAEVDAKTYMASMQTLDAAEASRKEYEKGFPKREDGKAAVPSGQVLSDLHREETVKVLKEAGVSMGVTPAAAAAGAGLGKVDSSRPSETRKGLETVAALVPTSFWMGSKMILRTVSQDAKPMVIDTSTKRGRAHASNAGGGRTDIALNAYKPDTSAHGWSSTALHEIIHGAENANGYLRALEQAYMKQRIAPDEKLVTLRTITGQTGYRSGEVAYRDQWQMEYAGKIYGTGSVRRSSLPRGSGGNAAENYEILTTGFQGVFYGMKIDEGHRAFTLGTILLGSTVNP